MNVKVAIPGAPLSKIPDRYGYLRNGGPVCPANVLYLRLFEPNRTAGFGSKVLLGCLLILALLFFAIALNAVVQGQLFSGATGVLVGIGFVASAFAVSIRIKLATEDATAIRDGDYRLGWYIDGGTLLLRTSNGFSSFPKAYVVSARVHSRYDTELKQTEQTLILEYRNEHQSCYAMQLDFRYRESIGCVAQQIERWKASGT